MRKIILLRPVKDGDSEELFCRRIFLRSKTKMIMNFAKQNIFVLLLLSVVTIGFKNKEITIPPGRSVAFDYLVIIKEIPPEAQELKVWLPLLTQNDYQIIDEVIIEPQDSYTITTDKTYHNHILSYFFKSPQQSEIKINVRYKVKRYEYAKKPGLYFLQHRKLYDFLAARKFLSYAAKKIFRPEGGIFLKESVAPEDLTRYSQPDRLVTLSPQIRELSAKITRAQKTTLAKARAIYDYVFANVSYDKTISGWGRGDAQRVCLVKAGNCTDFHSLFIALARASNIPAKFVIGVPLKEEKEGRIAGYHCWAEFYDEKLGWVPVDISEAWKDKAKRDYYFGSITENRLEFTQGRDIILEPAQNGEPLNYFVYPYVELNGQEFKNVEVNFSYKDQLPDRIKDRG